MSKVYMEITTDKFQLPVKVAESPAELARMCGVPRYRIYNYLDHVKNGRIKNPKYIKVVLED